VNGYVEAGYSVVLVVLALYSARLVLRRRSLARWLPERDGRSAEGPAATETPMPVPVPTNPAGPEREKAG
jgi:hypothetical protein